MDAQWSDFLSRLAARRARDSTFEEYGADAHFYALFPSLGETRVANFERAHGISLPDPFRIYLRDLSSGGAGPGNGLYYFGPEPTPPETVFSRQEQEAMHEKTAENWTSLQALPASIRDRYPRDRETHSAQSLKARLASFALPAGLACASPFPARNDARVDVAEDGLSGFLPLCDFGCDMIAGLVLNGAFRGQVWIATEGTVAPHRDMPVYGHAVPDAAAANFYAWMSWWLETTTVAERP